MKKNWRYMKLSDICREVLYGYNAPATTKPTGIRLLRVTDIASGEVNWDEVPFCEISSKDYKRYHLRVGDIVIARMGTIGVSAIIKEDVPAVAASYLIIHRVDPTIAGAKFISYLLHSRYYWEFIWSHGSSGAVQPNINAKTLGEFQFPLPPLPEQRAIAHILGTLDDKIELNRRMNETLEAMARALFKSWFIDFEPVRAKVEGRWKKGQSLPGLPAHLYDIFPDRLVNSELGKIPEGWRLLELSEVFEINPPRHLQKGEIAPYLDMSNMPTNRHMPIAVIPRAFSSGTKFINGDTLIARITPCLENGKTAFVNFLKSDQVGWGSTELIVLRPKPPLPPEFGYCLARHSEFREYAIHSMTGTSGRQRVQLAALARYIFVVPTEKVACVFGNAIKQFFSRGIKAYYESRTLALLRDNILPKIIQGEIQVKDAEQLLKERSL